MQRPFFYPQPDTLFRAYEKAYAPAGSEANAFSSIQIQTSQDFRVQISESIKAACPSSLSLNHQPRSS
jgi:hypothetical protein